MAERNGGRNQDGRVEMLGVLVGLGLALFVAFFGSLIVLGIAALAGSAGLGAAATVLGAVADVGLLLSLAIAVAMLAGVLVWFVLTLYRAGRAAARRE